MLPEIAIADAYGAGFEFSPPNKVASCNDLLAFQKHELYDIQGKYTDDTQLTIAISEALLEKETPTKEDFAKAILSCFKRDPRPGYSKGFYEILSTSNDVEDLLTNLNPNSERNGAAIRSVPIGYLKCIEKVTEVATIQSSITHNTPIGIASSVTVATVAHYALHKGLQVQNITQVLATHKLDQWDFNWTKAVSVDAFDTLSAALTCLVNKRSISELLKSCVDLCGDTDSVASIAVGLASCFNEYSNDLPSALIDNLDESTYGINYLNALEAKLQYRYR